MMMQMISKMMTTFSISQSAKKMRGDLPPSSRETFLRFESAQDLEGYTMMMMMMMAKMMTQPHDSVANLS